MKQKVLLFSFSGFSDENANGITMKNLLSAWMAEEKAEFYCDTQRPDYTAAHSYFRVTDVQAIKSFFGKKSRLVLNWSGDVPEERMSGSAKQTKEPKRIPGWLKKYKYNFALKWIREYCWILGPWGKKKFWNWVQEVSPDVIIYMVGESVFMDRLVLSSCERTGKPLILYDGEAYRLIDLGQRRGLERAYYRLVEKQYRKLAEKASLCVYNCDTLKTEYEAMYPESPQGVIAYNSAQCLNMPYEPGDSLKITYFGNLGVGRSEELLRIAEVLRRVDNALILDIYGNATQEQKEKFVTASNIRYHGFVDAETLQEIISRSDILLHAETFDPERKKKLKYAFSTKIAQCLCSGRAFVSFAPQEMASSRYLKEVEGVALVSDEEELERVLRRLVSDPEWRKACAEKALRTGLENHQTHVTAARLREEVEKIIC